MAITNLQNSLITKLITLIDTKGTPAIEDDTIVARGYEVDGPYGFEETMIIKDLYTGKERKIDWSSETVSVSFERTNTTQCRNLINIITTAKQDDRLDDNEKKAIAHHLKPGFEYRTILLCKALKVPRNDPSDKKPLIDFSLYETGIKKGKEKFVREQYYSLLDSELEKRVNDIELLLKNEKDEDLIENYNKIKDDLIENVENYKIDLNQVKLLTIFEMVGGWPSLLNPSPFSV